MQWVRVIEFNSIIMNAGSLTICIGAEAKGLGIHVQLGPVAGALGKIPAVSQGEAFSGY